MPWADRDALIAGNIPYNITSPLLDKALMPPRPRRVVFLVQKEVADRVSAPPGSDAYGALSVGVQAVATGERLFIVPAGAFMPRPKVDSAVLRLTPRADAAGAGCVHRHFPPGRGRDFSPSGGSSWLADSVNSPGCSPERALALLAAGRGGAHGASGECSTHPPSIP